MYAYTERLQGRLRWMTKQWQGRNQGQWYNQGAGIKHTFAMLLFKHRALDLLQVIADLPSLSHLKLQQSINQEAPLINMAFLFIACNTIEGLRALGKPSLSELQLLGLSWDASCYIWDQALPGYPRGPERQVLLAAFLAHVQKLHLRLPWCMLQDFWFFFNLNTGRERWPEVPGLPAQGLVLRELIMEVEDRGAFQSYTGGGLPCWRGAACIRACPYERGVLPVAGVL